MQPQKRNWNPCDITREKAMAILLALETQKPSWTDKQRAQFLYKAGYWSVKLAGKPLSPGGISQMRKLAGQAGVEPADLSEYFKKKSVVIEVEPAQAPPQQIPKTTDGSKLIRAIHAVTGLDSMTDGDKLAIIELITQAVEP